MNSRSKLSQRIVQVGSKRLVDWAQLQFGPKEVMQIETDRVLEDLGRGAAEVASVTTFTRHGPMQQEIRAVLYVVPNIHSLLDLLDEIEMEAYHRGHDDALGLVRG